MGNVNTTTVAREDEHKRIMRDAEYSASLINNLYMDDHRSRRALNHLTEEMAELIVEINKFVNRNKAHRLTYMIEEAADVYILLDQLIRVYGREEFLNRVEDKVKRYRGRFPNRDASEY